MEPKYSDEEVLNVFRKQFPDEKTLTVSDLTDALDVGERAAQNYVTALHERNRLVLESEGKPNHWRLADTEPKDPVYRDELAKAERWGNQATHFGHALVVLAVGILAAAGLITSNHLFAQAFNIYVPLLDSSAASTAVWVGVSGSLFFGVGGVSLLAGAALPRAAQWYIDETVPEETE